MKSARTLLVTGGAGYIGSHACVELLQAGHEVVVVDNLCNSRRETLNVYGKDNPPPGGNAGQSGSRTDK